MYMRDKPKRVYDINQYLNGKKSCDVHIEWSISPREISEFLKYYRIYRNDKFIGVTKQVIFLDKEVNVKDAMAPIHYRIDAVSLKNEIIATFGANA